MGGLSTAPRESGTTRNDHCGMATPSHAPAERNRAGGNEEREAAFEPARNVATAQQNRLPRTIPATARIGPRARITVTTAWWRSADAWLGVAIPQRLRGWSPTSRACT